MILAAALLIAALLLIATCAVFAEPWQRHRYDQAIAKARSIFTPDGHVTDAALEAFIADEFLHEASDA